MIRTYSNKRIYKNFKIALRLSIVSLILAVLSVIAHACTYFLRVPKPPMDSTKIFIIILFYLLMLLVPTSVLSWCAWSLRHRKQDARKTIQETKWHNDIVSIITPFIVSFAPYFTLLSSFASFLISLCFGHSDASGFLECARMCGYIFPSHAFVYMADIYLKRNCTLIMQEWKSDPPEFVKQQEIEKAKRQEEKEKQKAEQAEQRAAEEKRRKETQCRSLLQTCGMRFFIKYYRQIKTLPLRDVVLSENYSPEEKDERLTAAKKIIESNLTHLALNTIIEVYGNSLESEEIEQAKKLLADFSAEQCLESNGPHDEAQEMPIEIASTQCFQNIEQSDKGQTSKLYDPYDE